MNHHSNHNCAGFCQIDLNHHQLLLFKDDFTYLGGIYFFEVGFGCYLRDLERIAEIFDCLVGQVGGMIRLFVNQIGSFFKFKNMFDK